MGMVESLLKLVNLPWQVPDYSTVCRRQQTLKVRICNNANHDYRCQILFGQLEPESTWRDRPDQSALPHTLSA